MRGGTDMSQARRVAEYSQSFLVSERDRLTLAVKEPRSPRSAGVLYSRLSAILRELDQRAFDAYLAYEGRVLLFGGLGVHRAEVEVAEPLEVRTRCGLVHQRATWTLLAVDCPQCPRLQEETSRFLREVDPG